MKNTLKHPLTGAPIVPAGFRKDGRAIWPIMGGSEDAAAEAGGAATQEAATEGDAEAATLAATEAEQAAAAEAALGDAGKKALDAMKAKWKAAETKAQQSAAALAAAEAKAAGTEAEHVRQLEEQRVKDEALAGANERILKADIRTVAKGKLADPNDAFRFPEEIDLSAFEANADGEFDSAAIAQAIDSLIAKKPYLAAQGGSKFNGSADGGARNGQPSTLDTQIADAMKARDFQTAIALKQQRAAELKDKK